ncbi:MAG: hypothetical protein JNL64_01885 [Blastocatellia bacterium]|nr:hypothetical protein [Blastocatellia bacterium]
MKIFRNWFVLALTVTLMSLTANAAWSDWAPIPDGLAIGEPSVVITDDGTIHVMVRGNDNALWWTRSKDGGQSWYGNKTSQKWTKVGGVLTSSPSCMEPIPNVVECYVRNIEKGVSQIDRINDAWGPWANIGGIIMTNVSATALNRETRQLYVVNTSGRIARNMWDARNFSPAKWVGWFNWEDEVGKNSWISCSDLGGNSTVHFGGNVEIQDYNLACVVNLPGGNLSLLSRSSAKDTIVPNFAKATSEYPTSVKLHSLGTAMDLYFVDKDKKLKRGVYNLKTGWTGPFETIGNGTFTSGPSCDTGSAKTNVNAVCTARGGDGAIWYSLRRPGNDIGPGIDPGKVSTGGILFSAGNAGTDVNLMYSRPSAPMGTRLVIPRQDAIGCSTAATSCDVNLGLFLVRQNASSHSIVKVLMRSDKTKSNGDAVVFASDPVIFPTGKKTVATSVRVELVVGVPTKVQIKVFPTDSKFTDVDYYESFTGEVMIQK